MLNQTRQPNTDSLLRDVVALNRVELVEEIERLKEKHALDIRRLEIESYRAEFELAAKLRAVMGGSDHEYAFNKNDMLLHSDRSPLGKILFRDDGRPKKPLRLILFSSSGRPRSLTSRLVFHKNGRPRKSFVQWMTSKDYQSRPEAHRF